MISFFRPPPTITRQEIQNRKRADRVVDRVTKLGERTTETMKKHIFSQEKNHYSQVIFGAPKK